MAIFNLPALNPYEFQEMVNDIVSASRGVHVERFKQGKDWGIDGRMNLSDGEFGIIQSKHYTESGVKTLIRDLKKYELPKIKKLKPRQVVIATSVGLSPKDKKEIFDSFCPYIMSTGDILGKDDINSFLTEFSSIVKNYPKLWIQTSEVVSNIINAGAINISRQLIIRAAECQNFYIVTEQYKRARALLESEQIVLITGGPGVGKTSIAEQLCLEVVAEGYELNVIMHNIDEAFAALSVEKKQLFYFDDFLGSNFLEILRFNEDSKIMRFIDIVRKNPSLSLILTSRTNILDQAYNIGEAFSRGKIKNREFLLTVSDYSEFEKAMILYMFIWKSNISNKQLKKFISKKIYKDIIKHKNYNPRLLEVITSDDAVEGKNNDEYLDYIKESLSNPKDVWKQPYECQLDEYSRVILDLVVLNGGEMYEIHLEQAYSNYLKSRNEVDVLSVRSDFYTVVELLSRSFLKRSILSEELVKYEVFNPSISDYVIGRYNARPLAWAKICSFYPFHAGIEFLHSFSNVNHELTAKIAEIILAGEMSGNNTINFNCFAMLADLLLEDDFERIFSAYDFSFIHRYLEESLKHNDKILSSFAGPDNFVNAGSNNINFSLLEPGELTYLFGVEVRFISSVIEILNVDYEEIVEIIKMILKFPNDEFDYLYEVSILLNDIVLENNDYDIVNPLFYEKLYPMLEYGEFDSFVIRWKSIIKKSIIKIKSGNVDPYIPLGYKRFISKFHNFDYLIDVEKISDMIVLEYCSLFSSITKNDAIEFVEEHWIEMVDICFERRGKKLNVKVEDEHKNINIDCLFGDMLREKYC